MSIGHIPNAGLVILALPESIYPDKSLIIGGSAANLDGSLSTAQLEAWKKIVEERAKDVVNGELDVAVVGDGVTFVKEGDKIVVASHCRLQVIYIDVEGESYPKMYWVLRESDILTKIG